MSSSTLAGPVPHGSWHTAVGAGPHGRQVRAPTYWSADWRKVQENHATAFPVSAWAYARWAKSTAQATWRGISANSTPSSSETAEHAATIEQLLEVQRCRPHRRPQHPHILPAAAQPSRSSNNLRACRCERWEEHARLHERVGCQSRWPAKPSCITGIAAKRCPAMKPRICMEAAGGEGRPDRSARRPTYVVAGDGSRQQARQGASNWGWTVIDEAALLAMLKLKLQRSDAMAVREILRKWATRACCASPSRSTSFDSRCSCRLLITEMLDTMHSANGAGLAAPQIGVDLATGDLRHQPGQPALSGGTARAAKPC